MRGSAFCGCGAHRSVAQRLEVGCEPRRRKVVESLNVGGPVRDRRRKRRLRLGTRTRFGFNGRNDMEPSQSSTLTKLPLIAAGLAWAFAAIAVSGTPPLATTGQTSITLLGGVSTVVQHDNTSWDSTKTLKTPISPDPGTNSGTVSWTVTVTQTAVSDQMIQADC